MVSKINKKKAKENGLVLSPILEKKVDELVEAKKKELKRMKLAAKMKKLCDKADGMYAFILFDASTKPIPGDSMQVFDMKATWRKVKDNIKTPSELLKK